MNLFDKYLSEKRLLEALLQYKTLNDSSGVLQKPFIRLEFEIEKIDLIEVYSKIESNQKFYLKNRDNTYEILGINNIYNDLLSINDYPKPVLYARKFSSSKDKDFAFIPEWGIVRLDQTILFINVPTTSLESIIENFNSYKLKFDLRTYNDSPVKIKSIIHSPDYQNWENAINNCLNIFKQKKAKKIVMARKSIIKFEENISEIDVLKKIAADSVDSYLYCIKFDSDTSFLGDSPERLFSVNDNKIYADALAGTVKRTGDPTLDESLSYELLNSLKDLREHQYVVDYLNQKLEKICNQIDFPANPVVKKLKTVMHLFTPVTGNLKDLVTPIELLDLLHPTPAVNGIPEDLTPNLIRELEPFDRELYAGAIGIIDNNFCEFAVAIRSGYFRQGCLELFSGAGIVEGSNPKEEWEEINSKLENIKGRLK